MKVLFVPLHIGGHTNAVIGLAKEMTKRGHEVVFATHKTREKLLTGNQFVVELIDASALTGEEFSNEFLYLTSSDYLVQRIFKSSIKYDWIKQLKNMINAPNVDEQLKNVILKVKPDVLVIDNLFYPALCNSGLPWVSFWSANPIYIEEPKSVFPFGFGENLIKLLFYLNSKNINRIRRLNDLRIFLAFLEIWKKN